VARLPFRRKKIEKPDTTNIGGSSTMIPYVSKGSWYYPQTLPEYNPDLIGKSGIRVFDRMKRSDAQVRGSLRMVKAPILSAQWYMNPSDDSQLAHEKADLVWWQLTNMQRPLMEFLNETTYSLDYGEYAFELQWEMDEWTPDATADRPKPRTRPVARLVDLAPRHPIRNTWWNFDNDKLQSLDWGLYPTQPIPANKLAVFTFDKEADDPQGLSILRSAYTHYFYKYNLYSIDAIQKERHALGIPDVELPPGADEKEKTLAIQMAKNLRANEKAYVVRPAGWTIGFLKPEGQLVNVLDSAVHHGLMILQNVLAQFLAIGASETGSRATATTMTEAFDSALRFTADFILGVINQQIVQRIVDYNYLVSEPYPKLAIRHLRDNDIWRSLSVALRNLGLSGFITPDTDLETFLRLVMELPPPSDEVQARSLEDRLSMLRKGPQGGPDSPQQG
jgi:hypothetical protein